MFQTTIALPSNTTPRHPDVPVCLIDRIPLCAMSDRSAIEWTDATWNPVTGCTKLSPGCDHCYASTFAERFRGVRGHPYEGGFDLTLHPERLAVPIKWRSPRRIFVNSMSDLFHEDVPDDFIQGVFAVMEEASWHTFQVLTKRPRRMLSLSSTLSWPENVWAGTSVELNRFAWRANHYLRQVPAAVRFVSAEPLLGPLPGLRLDSLQWVITGGESGSKARPCDPQWVRDLRDRCVAARVSFFHKQWGGRKPRTAGRLLDGRTWDQFPNEAVKALAEEARG
jgi:protein gp37